MIAGSYIAKLVALGLAVAVHGAVLLALGPGGREAVAVEGAEGAGEVRLGQGFSDMAAGRLEAQAAVDAVQAEAPEKVEATAAEAVVPVEQAEVVRAEAVPDTPARAEARPARERIAGAAPESAAVGQSLRPRRRDPAREKASETARDKPRPAAPKGNAARDARAGETTGQAQARAESRAAQGAADAAGSAAASNYPGLVMRRLSRAGRPRVNARGEAVVGFTIADNGGLAALGIARSSGSAALDRAALGIVRGAAPFPKPPRGAERRFSIRIRGR
ncbi:energy transducer TonB [Rhodobacteraceae bacterium AsT-22]|nr:energy transducer TonB [Rhodobacteraceae bacterium AsT-22]